MISKDPRLQLELPILDLASATETGAHTNLDWPRADHSAEASQVQVQDSDVVAWEVEQSVTDAGGIQRLIDTKQARFAVEARCLFTAWCDLFIGTTESNIVTVKIPINLTRGDIFLCPGIVTSEDCELETSDLHTIWHPPQGSHISVPAGYWLVLGRPIKVNTSEKDAMVYFVKNNNLLEGEMRISVQNQPDDVRFEVALHPQTLLQAKADPRFLWGCHLTAMAMLPYTEEYEIEEREGAPLVPGSNIGQQLANQLHAAGIPLWNEKEDWDPAKALTAEGLLRIPEPSHQHDDDDE